MGPEQDRSEASGRRSGAAQGHDGGEGLRARRTFTPEERRQAVEAFHASDLSQHAFARQWGLSHVTLGKWLRAHAARGPQGLERLSEGPARRRGKAPLPEALKAEIVAAKEAHEGFGWKRLTAWLWRVAGVQVSATSVRRVSAAAGLGPAVPPRGRRVRRAPPPRRFERSRPGELWQTDITYLDVPWRRRSLYLVVFLDDFSRYVVGHGLFTNQRAEIVLETYEQATARYGRPKEVLSDQGRQYFAWRGKSAFQKLLQRDGVAHVVSRAQHPQTLGKCERLWASVKKELWERVSPRDLEEARERLGHYFAHHNHQRPHQSLGGLVPADRFFGVDSQVRAALEETVAQNAIRMALGEKPRRPLFLLGQIDGQSVSLHGEQGRIVVQTPAGRSEIATRDLGVTPALGGEVKDGQTKQPDECGPAGAVGDAALDDAGGEVAGDGSLAGDDAGSDAAGPDAPPAGAQAHEVPGAHDDAGAGTGAVAQRDAGATGEGAPDGHGGAQGLAGQEQP